MFFLKSGLLSPYISELFEIWHGLAIIVGLSRIIEVRWSFFRLVQIAVQSVCGKVGVLTSVGFFLLRPSFQLGVS